MPRDGVECNDAPTRPTARRVTTYDATVVTRLVACLFTPAFLLDLTILC